jgi:hypothetical protein
MDISGIVFIEEGNRQDIHLYQEGVFWKAYERSAYLFVRYIKAYRTKKRYYKSIAQDIVSISFPDIVFSGLLSGCELVPCAVL